MKKVGKVNNFLLEQGRIHSLKNMKVVAEFVVDRTFSFTENDTGESGPRFSEVVESALRLNYKHNSVDSISEDSSFRLAFFASTSKPEPKD